MKIKTHYFTEQQLKAIEKHSKAKGLTASELLRRIIDKYFEDLQKEQKEQKETK